MTTIKKTLSTTKSESEISNSASVASPEEKKAFLASVRSALITEEVHPDLAKICPHIPVPGTDLLEVIVANGNYVTTKEMQRLCCTQGELFSAAAANQKNDTVCFASVDEALGIPRPDEENVMLYILCTPQPASGAAVLLNRDAMQKASDAIGGDLFILPSSIHEVLLVSSVGLRPEELEGLVQSMNRSEVRPEEVLSNHVYRYDCQTKQLSMGMEQHFCPEMKSQADNNAKERRCRR